MIHSGSFSIGPGIHISLKGENRLKMDDRKNRTQSEKLVFLQLLVGKTSSSTGLEVALSVASHRNDGTKAQ